MYIYIYIYIIFIIYNIIYLGSEMFNYRVPKLITFFNKKIDQRAIHLLRLIII